MSHDTIPFGYPAICKNPNHEVSWHSMDIPAHSDWSEQELVKLGRGAGHVGGDASDFGCASEAGVPWEQPTTRKTHMHLPSLRHPLTSLTVNPVCQFPSCIHLRLNFQERNRTLSHLLLGIYPIPSFGYSKLQPRPSNTTSNLP